MEQSYIALTSALVFVSDVYKRGVLYIQHQFTWAMFGIVPSERLVVDSYGHIYVYAHSRVERPFAIHPFVCVVASKAELK